MALSGATGGLTNPQFASRFLDTVGDGTGSIHMNVDGSVTPVEFKIICPPQKKLIGYSFSVMVGGAGNWEIGSYGGIEVGLPNGILGFIDRVGEARQLWFAQLPVQTNADWLAYCSYEQMEWSLDYDAARYTYDFRAEGPGLVLYPGDVGGLIMNDNLTSLTDHVCRFGITEYDYFIPTI